MHALPFSMCLLRTAHTPPWVSGGLFAQCHFSCLYLGLLKVLKLV